MDKLTKKNFEAHLNRLLRTLPEDEAVTAFKDISGHGYPATDTRIKYHINEGNAAAILRRCNPGAFAIGYRDWVHYLTHKNFGLKNRFKTKK